jgi:hypothetical protein
MSQTRPIRRSDRPRRTTSWLRAASVLLLAALLLGPATGLAWGLHHLAHDHDEAPLSSQHECDLCLASHAPIETSPQPATVAKPTVVGSAAATPGVSTGWRFVSPTAPRGPPAC